MQNQNGSLTHNTPPPPHIGVRYSVIKHNNNNHSGSLNVVVILILILLSGGSTFLSFGKLSRLEQEKKKIREEKNREEEEMNTTGLWAFHD